MLWYLLNSNIKHDNMGNFKKKNEVIMQDLDKTQQ